MLHTFHIIFGLAGFHNLLPLPRPMEGLDRAKHRAFEFGNFLLCGHPTWIHAGPRARPRPAASLGGGAPAARAAERWGRATGRRPRRPPRPWPPGPHRLSFPSVDSRWDLVPSSPTPLPQPGGPAPVASLAAAGGPSGVRLAARCAAVCVFHVPAAVRDPEGDAYLPGRRGRGGIRMHSLGPD